MTKKDPVKRKSSGIRASLCPNCSNQLNDSIIPPEALQGYQIQRLKIELEFSNSELTAVRAELDAAK